MPEEKVEEVQEETIEESPEESEVPEVVEDYLRETEDKYEVPEEKVSEPTEEEESPVEPTTEVEKTPPVEEKPAEEPEVPLEDVVEQTTERVLKKAGITKEEKEEAEDEGFKFAWEDRGEDRPASWREQTEETARFVKWQEDQEAKAKRAETEKQMEVQKKTIEETNKEWDRQLDYLRQKEYIPQIAPEVKKKLDKGEGLTVEDAKDPGIVAQKNLFDKMGEISRTREKPIVDLVHIYHEYIKSTEKKKPAGAKAPVSGGRPAVSQKTDEDISYEELHKADFEDLINI